MAFADYNKAVAYVKDICGTRPLILNNARHGVITFALSRLQYEEALKVLNSRHGRATPSTVGMPDAVQYKEHHWNLTEHRSIALRKDHYLKRAPTMRNEYLISIRDFGEEL